MKSNNQQQSTTATTTTTDVAISHSSAIAEATKAEFQVCYNSIFQKNKNYFHINQSIKHPSFFFKKKSTFFVVLNKFF